MAFEPARPVAEGEKVDKNRRRGRGALSNTVGRFEGLTVERFDDGWDSLEDLPAFKTEVREEVVKSIIATNSSPDVGFDQSINPYRGCEHGCIYCYARPTHAYLGLSAGLDFETKLTVKANAVEALRRELAHPKYVPKLIALGANTDVYQPLEKERGLTRALLSVLEEHDHPISIVTKSALILRDIDILQRMAAKGLVRVAISITTLDHRLARKLEPRATTPRRRLQAMEALAKAGVPVSVMLAPIIPAINDAEIENILKACAAAGARSAAYVLLRLPLEISGLFQEWLGAEFPDRARRVMHLMRSMRGGKDYTSDFSNRQTGAGVYADLIKDRFARAVRRYSLDQPQPPLRCDLFKRGSGEQLSLFFGQN